MISARLTFTLLLFIPLINFSFLLVSDLNKVFGKSGIMTASGIVTFSVISLLIICALMIYKRSFKIFLLLIITVCVFLPVLFIYIDSKNIELQTAVVAVSLFFLLYALNYRERKYSLSTVLIRSLIQHCLMIIFLIIASTKFDLLSINWNRYSILLYFTLIYIFTFIVEYTVKVKKNNWVIGIFSIYFIAIVTSYMQFEYFNYILTLAFPLFILGRQLRYIKYDKRIIELLFENPFKLLVVSFAGIILIGTVMLSMPFASSVQKSIQFIDALFTATSATCVTGLIVVDTAVDFSFAGQLIILFLIQIGGIGIITIMTFVSVLMGQAIGFSKEYVVGDLIGSKRPKLVYSMIKFIILGTFAFEIIGAIILSISFYIMDIPLPNAIWKGVFHAISAFCNAGFALQNDSLIMYNTNIIILSTVSVLIIIGGIGFPVIAFIKELILRNTNVRRMPISIKASIWATFILLLSGYIFFLAFEYNKSFHGLAPIHKHFNAFFLSVTARTAGFNTIDMNHLTNVSTFFLWILMFIGGGTGSTAGGIKITTLSVLFAILISYIKGQRDVTLFYKSISIETIKKTIVLFISSLFLITVFIFVIELTHNISLGKAIFEVFSAYGTVGLSLGATAKLTFFGKFMVLLLMFCGRVSILTLISLFITSRTSKVKYPEEQMLIG